MMYKEHQWESGIYRITLIDLAHLKLCTFRQNSINSLESGGFIMGRRILSTTDCIVDEITTPMAGDIQKRCFFYRGEGHNAELEKYWLKTHKKGQLLGVWHTHPEPDPSPSPKDYKDWKNVLDKCVGRNQPLYFVIAGQETTRVWVGIKRKFKKRHFLPCDFQGVF